MNLALFDFDGTITTREMFPDFMRFAVTPRRRAVGALLLAPLVAGYRAGWISGNATRASVVQVGLRGADATALAALGETFARDVLPGALRADVMARIAWHRAQGDRVVVVSGGLDVYLDPWCRQHGLELLCSELAVEGECVTGRYRGAQCVGEEKVRRVRALCDPSSFAAIYAYGDTHEDRAMLAMAHHRTYRGQLQP